MMSSPVYGPATAARPTLPSSTQRPKTGGRNPHRQMLLAPVRAAGDDFTNPFFYGKALAEVLNERLGNLAADTLAFAGTAEAELRKALDDIQEEVMERAQEEIGIQNGNTNGNSPSRIGGKGGNGGGSGRAIAARAGAAAALDEDEIVDNLRAEIASTRSLIQQTKVAMASKTKR